MPMPITRPKLHKTGRLATFQAITGNSESGFLAIVGFEVRILEQPKSLLVIRNEKPNCAR